MVVWGGIYKKSLRPYDIAVRADRCCCYFPFPVFRWNREFMMTIVDQSRSRIRGEIKVEIFLLRRIAGIVFQGAASDIEGVTP